MKENKQIVRRWMESIGTGDLETAADLTARSWVLRDGRQDFPDRIAALGSLQNTSSYHWLILDIHSWKDFVVVRFTSLSAPAYSALFLHRIKNGLVQESWQNIGAPASLLEPFENGETEEDDFSLLPCGFHARRGRH